MKEQLSALMDGELDLDAHPHLYKALRSDEDAADCWATWHLIGDVMRREPVMPSDLGARVMQALESEPTVLAPRRTWRDWMRSEYVVPLVATAAAVAFVSWMVWQPDMAIKTEIAQPSLAQAAIPPDILNSYMLAHHEYAPSNGVQHGYDIQPANLTAPGH
ncbi:MAG: sigma-E factor negative regulatory protein [Methylophilaceae bacterium]|nr:sigma-E factor negative regulatory protein [Methylophilaceae bacterium]